jgi:hypothetical protein
MVACKKIHFKKQNREIAGVDTVTNKQVATKSLKTSKPVNQ